MRRALTAHMRRECRQGPEGSLIDEFVDLLDDKTWGEAISEFNKLHETKVGDKSVFMPLRLEKLYGQASETAEDGDKFFRGKQVTTAGVKRIKGSELEVGDIMENSIANIEDAIGRAKANDSLVTLANLVRQDPEKFKGIT